MSSDQDNRPERQIREQAADWVIRGADEGLTSEEQAELEDWLSANPRHRQEFERARRLFGDARVALIAEPDRTKRLFGRGRRSTLAGLAILIAAGGLFLLADGPLWLQADAMSAKNEMPVITLPDGSRVFLNSDSAIAEHFSGAERGVELLKGEAYFEVTPDAARPFTVEAGAGRIRVLGTAFNVNLFDRDAEVTVTQHAVTVTGSAESAPVALEAGNRVSYDGSGRLGLVEAVPEGQEVPWRQGRLIFEERSILRVLDEVARHLPGKVVIVKRGITDRRISGSFDLKDPREAMDNFAATFGLRVVQAGPFLTMIY